MSKAYARKHVEGMWVMLCSFSGSDPCIPASSLACLMYHYTSHESFAQRGSLGMQMFLERRLKGAALASHAVYSDEDYFRSVTGLPFTKWIHCKRTETTVRTLTPQIS